MSFNGILVDKQKNRKKMRKSNKKIKKQEKSAKKIKIKLIKIIEVRVWLEEKKTLKKWTMGFK
jgi:hypothetical protein